MLWDRCLSSPVCPVCNVGVLWPNGWMDQDETWHGGRPRPREHCVGWGPSLPPPKKKEGRAHSQISDPCLLWPNGWMDQDATWYGGRPRPRRHCVKWGPSSPPGNKRGRAPIFGSCLLWPNGSMNQDATWHTCWPRPRPHCDRWGPSSPHGKGTAAPPPNFRQVSTVAKWSPISATSELLLTHPVCIKLCYRSHSDKRQ